MTSTGINVLRYSAFGFGIIYGFTHHTSLKIAGREAQARHDYQQKQHKIEEAKKAWERKNSPPSGVISDPENPQFDLEKWINYAAEQKAS